MGGVEHRHRLGFLETGEEEEVRVLAELVLHVTVAHRFRAGRDQGDALRDGCEEARSPLGEAVGVHGRGG